MAGLPIHKRLFFKLIFFFTLIVFIGSAIGVYVSLKITGNEFNKTLKKQFRSNIEITENFFSFLGQTAMIWSKNIASDENLRTLAAQSDRDAIITRCMYLLKRASADILILLDREGNVVVKSNDTNKYGDSLLYWNLVREAISGGIPSTSIVHDDGNFIIYSSGIINSTNDSGNVSGVVLLGYAINDEFLRKIKGNINTHITIVRKRAVMASSFNVGEKRLNTIPISYIEYQMLLDNQLDVSEQDLFGGKYFVAARNLRMMDKRMPGSMLLAYPMDEMRTIEKRLNWEFALLFASSFILIVIIGGYLSKRVIMPINKLIKQTKNITADRPTSNVFVDTGDEVSVLANQFNIMIDSIKSKNQALKAHTENLENKVVERTQELKFAEQKTNAILKSIGEGIVTTDLNSSIQYANQELLKIFGYSYEEIRGQHISMLMPEKYKASHAEGMKRYLEGGASKVLGKRLELEGLRKDGSIFPLEIRIEETNVDGKNKFFTAAIQDITERRQTEEQIKASLREKEILIKEVYHRTKNNMSVICSLLNMQSNTIKDEKMISILMEIENRIKSMSLVHEKLYQTKDLSRINLKSYIEDLAYKLLRAYRIYPRKIFLKFKTEDVFIPIDTAIPYGLVINEIITNSLKYAFPDNRDGEIKIELHSPDKEEIELRICDNGIGMPKDFNPRKRDTLGLQIIYNIAEKQLDGKIDLNCENGVDYRIKFKTQDYTKRI